METLQVDFERVGHLLLVLAVIAVAFETALTPIFNWRVFARHLEGKGWKTPITVILAIALLWGYDIDIFKEIIASIGKQGAENESWFLGRVITGLLVAGGSDGIFRMFAKVGIRNPAELKQKAAEEQAKAVKAAEEKAKATNKQDC